MLLNIFNIKYLRRIAISLISLLLISFSIIALKEHEKTERKIAINHSKDNLMARLNIIRAKIEESLNSKLLLTEALVSIILTDKEISKSRFDELSKYFISTDPDLISHVALSDKMKIKYIYPLKGNEKAIGLNYKMNKKQWPDVHKAMVEKRTVISGPLELVQGGKALISRSPIYVNDKYYGMIAIVIYLDQLYKKVGLDQDFPFQLAIKSMDTIRSKNKIFYGEPDVLKKKPVIQKVEIPGGTWHIAAIPIGGWESIQVDYFLDRLLAALLVITLIFSILILTKEIEKRQKTEEDLKKYFLAVEHSPDSIIITDYEGNIEYANPMFTMVTGYTSKEVIGKNANILKSGMTPENIYIDLWQTIKNGKVWKGAFKNKRKNGDIYIDHTQIAPIFNCKGKINHFVSIKKDITSTKRLEQVREDTERIVHHDLRNPLNGIISNSQYLLSQMEKGDKCFSILNEIYNSGLRMSQHIDNTLSIYKMEEGSYQVKAFEFDLINTMKDLNPDFKKHIKYNNLKLEYYLNEKPILWHENFPLVAEEGHIKSLLSNLIVNALEASPKDHVVTVKLFSDDNNNYVSIHNFGEIPPQIKDSFFQKYCTYGKKNGTGLGTYSAKLIANVHGGDITFTSSLSEGTLLIFYLPKK